MGGRSAPRTARPGSSMTRTSTPSSSSAITSALAVERETSRISRMGRTTRIASTCVRACGPAPNTVSTDAPRYSEKVRRQAARRTGPKRREVGPIHEGHRRACCAVQHEHNPLNHRDAAARVVSEHGHNLGGEVALPRKISRHEQADAPPTRSDRHTIRNHSLAGRELCERRLHRLDRLPHPDAEAHVGGCQNPQLHGAPVKGKFTVSSQGHFSAIHVRSPTRLGTPVPCLKQCSNGTGPKASAVASRFNRVQ